jgi:hypothetical protein
MKITWKQLKEMLKRKARRAGIKTTAAATAACRWRLM